MMESELKRCPFCGGEGMLQEYPNYGIRPAYRVGCPTCEAEINQFYPNKKTAIRAWNRRAEKKEDKDDGKRI